MIELRGSFQFLVQLQRLRTRVVRSVEAYHSVLWFGHLPLAEGLRFGQETADPGVWLTVDRVERVPPPSPPDILRPWITEQSLRDSSRTAPSLSRATTRAVQVVTSEGDLETVIEELLLEDCPEVPDALSGWVPIWQAWAVDDQPRAAVGEAYHRLYSMYRDSRALAETYEVVLGFGCLVTRSGGQDVRRHIVTMAATIELDLDSGRLTVVPSHSGGSWVTPGCVICLQYPGEDDIDRLFVTIMPHADGVPADTSPVSPLTDLAQAIEGAKAGDMVHFETPRGLQRTVVIEVQD